METAKEHMDSLTERFALWDKLTISHISRGNRESFETRIEDFNEHMLFVTLPNNLQTIHYGSEAEVSSLYEDGLYKFTVELDTAVLDGKQYLTLKPLSRVRHEQRRNAVRVPVRLEIEVAQIRRPIELSVTPNDLHWESTTTVNLSASGILVHSTRTNTVGDLVAIRFDRQHLPQAPEYGLASWRRIHKSNNIINVGLEFITRERIAHYLMKQEIQCLGNELMQMSEFHLNGISRFVFKYELKQRQSGVW
ncbi:PilZ domain-containing protein [Gemmatimonas aurantiaca]|nr:PilZ domain-containing protein [Gemmatimonas aurantiaca]